MRRARPVSSALARPWHGSWVRGITVNVVAPGFVTTDMTDVLPEKIKTEVKERVPVRRFGTPEDIADLVCYLAGPGASYLTGQVIAVDGGLTA